MNYSQFEVEDWSTITKQEVFDRVCAYAKTMRSKSATPSGDCRYRSSDGNRCFVGALLKNDDRIIEGYVAHNQPEISAASSEVKTLISFLQDAHDLYLRSLWPDSLRSIAIRFRIDPSAADTVGIMWAGGDSEQVQDRR